VSDSESEGLIATIRRLTKNGWLWLTGGIAALAILLTGVNQIARESREAPSEWGKTAKELSNWTYGYEDWKGEWTYFPEGRVDIADMQLTSHPIRLDVEISDGGQISGTIESQGICDKVPYFTDLALDGQINLLGDAEVRVLQWVGGYLRQFAKMKIHRDGDLMEVTPTDDPLGIFPGPLKIAKMPLNIAEKSSFCDGKEEKFILRALNRVKSETK
jgi:hypothetical protein